MLLPLILPLFLQRSIILGILFPSSVDSNYPPRTDMSHRSLLEFEPPICNAVSFSGCLSTKMILSWKHLVICHLDSASPKQSVPKVCLPYWKIYADFSLEVLCFVSQCLLLLVLLPVFQYRPFPKLLLASLFHWCLIPSKGNFFYIYQFAWLLFLGVPTSTCRMWVELKKLHLLALTFQPELENWIHLTIFSHIYWPEVVKPKGKPK